MQHTAEGVDLLGFGRAIREWQKLEASKHDLAQDEHTIFDCRETSLDFWLIRGRIKGCKCAGEQFARGQIHVRINKLNKLFSRVFCNKQHIGESMENN